MKHWPTWIKIVFIISGLLFVLACLATSFIFVIGRLSSSAPGTTNVAGDAPMGVVYITAITGLVTAASGFYGQVLAGRKLKLDYELAKQQLQAQQGPAKGKKPAGTKK